MQFLRSTKLKFYDIEIVDAFRPIFRGNSRVPAFTRGDNIAPRTRSSRTSMSPSRELDEHRKFFSIRPFFSREQRSETARDATSSRIIESSRKISRGLASSSRATSTRSIAQAQEDHRASREQVISARDERCRRSPPSNFARSLCSSFRGAFTISHAPSRELPLQRAAPNSSAVVRVEEELARHHTEAGRVSCWMPCEHVFGPRSCKDAELVIQARRRRMRTEFGRLDLERRLFHAPNWDGPGRHPRHNPQRAHDRRKPPLEALVIV